MEREDGVPFSLLCLRFIIISRDTAQKVPEATYDPQFPADNECVVHSPTKRSSCMHDGLGSPVRSFRSERELILTYYRRSNYRYTGGRRGWSSLKGISKPGKAATEGSWRAPEGESLEAML